MSPRGLSAPAGATAGGPGDGFRRWGGGDGPGEGRPGSDGELLAVVSGGKGVALAQVLGRLDRKRSDLGIAVGGFSTAGGERMVRPGVWELTVSLGAAPDETYRRRWERSPGPPNRPTPDSLSSPRASGSPTAAGACASVSSSTDT